MNFIEQFKRAIAVFGQFDSIRAREQAVYWQIFALINANNWNPIEVSQNDLLRRIGSTDHACTETLRRLKNAGLIDYNTRITGRCKGGTTITLTELRGSSGEVSGEVRGDSEACSTNTQYTTNKTLNLKQKNIYKKIEEEGPHARESGDTDTRSATEHTGGNPFKMPGFN